LKIFVVLLPGQIVKFRQGKQCSVWGDGVCPPLRIRPWTHVSATRCAELRHFTIIYVIGPISCSVSHHDIAVAYPISYRHRTLYRTNIATI